jgi:hypothetical protein
MSLIIAYVGKKGCVMAGDKRKIAYFGDKTNRDKLEDELYSGSIKNDEELKKRAEELKIALKITEDSNKIRNLEDALVGEVSTKSTFETKRKRIYGTTNSYQIIELLGSNIVNTEKGEKSIIIFGNKKTKSLANKLLNDLWQPDVSLKYMGEIFTKILEKIAMETPSIGKKYDVLVKHPNLSKKQSMDYLNTLIQRDVKVLGKFREKLQENLLNQVETIHMASKIINNGEVGVITNFENNMIQVTLNPDVQAFDTNWKQLVKPGENAIMFLSDENTAKINDKVIIKDEKICIERNNANLNCDIILCNL